MYTISTTSTNRLIDAIMYFIIICIAIFNAITGNLGSESTSFVSGALVIMMLLTRYSAILYRDTFDNLVCTAWTFLISWMILSAMALISIIKLGLLQHGGLSLLYGMLCMCGFVDICWSKPSQQLQMAESFV